MKTKAIGHQEAALEEDEKPERAEEASLGRRVPEGAMAMKAAVCSPWLSVLMGAELPHARGTWH